MVTTVAAATKFRGMDFATQLLLEIVLYRKYGNTSSEANHDAKVSNYYSVDRARLNGVLSKIVESISLHVINPGHTLGTLPDELKHLCTHHLSAESFSSICMSIIRAEEDMMLLCDRFQGALLLWILAHFEGSIEVSVANKRLYSRDSMYGERRFIMVVHNLCQTSCHEMPLDPFATVQLSTMLRGKWSNVLPGCCEDSKIFSPACRQPLYTMGLSDDYCRSGVLNREELYQVKIFAQKAILWIVNLDIESASGLGGGIAFERIGSSDQRRKTAVRVGDVIYRWPRILHDTLGKTSGRLMPPAFISPKPTEGFDTLRIYKLDPLPVSVFCECFPALLDLLEGISPRCECRVCRENGSIDECKEGCLREAAIGQLLVFIGHALADSLGIDDTSGLIRPNDYILEVRRLLGQLVKGLVSWDHWFNVAASTALGYSPKGTIGSAYWGHTLMAVQYGSSVVAAKWLDITQRIRLSRSFAVEIAEGQIPKVQGELALIHTMEKAKSGSDHGSTTVFQPSDVPDVWLQKIRNKDESKITIQHAVTGFQAPSFWRLITLISTETAQRIINPGDILMANIYSVSVEPRSVQCQHSNISAPMASLAKKYPAKYWHIWSFDEFAYGLGYGRSPNYFFHKYFGLRTKG